MSIFKTYDIRGIYNEDLTNKEAYLIGYYLIKFLNKNHLKIAHDKRNSYEDLTKYLIQGILDANATVDYIGLTSTPSFYYSLFEEQNQDGVIITASHNSKEYNGFKIISNFNSLDARNGLKDIEKLVLEDKDNKLETYNNLKEELDKKTLINFISEKNIKYNSNLNEYTKYLEKQFFEILNETELQMLENIDFSIDYSSGMSSLANNQYLKNTNLNYASINDVIDGNFPIHEPNPLVIEDFVKNLNKESNLGYFTAAFDGDGDRVAFYDEQGNFVLNDHIILAYMDHFSNEEKDYVVDLRVSKQAEDLAQSHNLKNHRIRVGRAFYKEFMDENECIFGAELSGHLFFERFRNFDNPDIALIYMLKIIAQNLLEKPDKKFSEIFEKYKHYYKLKETNLKVKDANQVLEYLKDKYQQNIELDIDGYSFNMGQFWFNIRKSNTEPVVRLNFEGISKEIVEEEFQKLIKEIETI